MKSTDQCNTLRPRRFVTILLTAFLQWAKTYTKKTLNVILNGAPTNARVAAFPYETFDCLALFSAVTPSVIAASAAGQTSRECQRAQFSFRPNFFHSRRTHIGGGSWSATLDHIEMDLADRGLGAPNLVRGVIDSLAARANQEAFDGAPIPTHLYNAILEELERGLQQGETDILLLSDLAHAANRGRVEAALRRGSIIFSLNPWGNCQKIQESSLDRFVDELACVQSSRVGFTKDLLPPEVTSLFGEQSPKTVRDWSRVAAYKVPTSSEKELRRVIALHVVRDAGNPPPQRIEGVPLRDHFEWADLMLQTASGRWDEWAVKLHPATAQYPGEAEIINTLLQRHGVPEHAILKTSSMLSLFNSFVPIFTFSGTIAYEYAARGGLAYSFSRTALKDVSVHIDSLDQLAAAAETRHAPPASPVQQDIAMRHLIGNQFSPIRSVCPNRPTFPTTSAALRHKTEIVAGFETWIKSKDKTRLQKIERHFEALIAAN
jgi:hypothetical protein